MRRKIVLFIIIAICFLLQTTVFRALTFANIGPNLLIIVFRYCPVFLSEYRMPSGKTVPFLRCL